MTTIISFGTRQFTAEQICERAIESQLLPQLMREIAIDEILTTWQPLSPPDPEVERERFDRCFRQIAALPATEGMSEAQLQQIVTRTVKLQQFQTETWGSQVGSYYLVRKAQLDRVVFSIVQVAELDIAQELFFRVRSGEVSFGDVAREYSQGIAANDGGKLGPIPMANLPPAIAGEVARLQPGQLSGLFGSEGAIGFMRLEERIPAQLDDNLRQFLLDELFEAWLQERIADDIGSISVTRENELN